MYRENLKELFNYEKITEEHKAAVREVISIMESSGMEVFAELLRKKFKIVENPCYDVRKSEMFNLMNKHGIYVTLQGHVTEDGVDYQYVNAIADIRNWDKLLEIIKNENSKVPE